MKVYDRIEFTDGMTVSHIRSLLNQAVEKYGEEHICFELENEEEYGDYYARGYLCCQREETESEKQIRLNRDKQTLEWKRKQYLQLKKELGDA